MPEPTDGFGQAILQGPRDWAFVSNSKSPDPAASHAAVSLVLVSSHRAIDAGSPTAHPALAGPWDPNDVLVLTVSSRT